jgi:alanine racemase
MARQPKPETAPPPAPPNVAGPPEAEAGGILTIDLGAVFDNYRALAVKVMPTECAAVVKGDAYGCGIDQVTAALSRAGCKTFFVAHLDEARRVRRLAPEAVIYVLNGFTTGSGPAFAEVYARPIINSSVELAEWDQFVATSGWSGGVGLHVDTGMNRLGLSLDETAAVAARMQSENHGLTLLMSHFACADQPQHPLNDQQIRQFREIRTLFRGIPGSLANSSGIFLDPSAYCDMVRCSASTPPPAGRTR